MEDIDREWYRLPNTWRMPVQITIQGRVVKAVIPAAPKKPSPHKRGEICGFSADARLRMLSLVSALEWERCGRSSFLSLTWRDDWGCPDACELRRCRDHMHQKIERLTNREQPGIWRVEWEVRKSGRRMGEIMPHIHVIYFGIKYIPKEWIEASWNGVHESEGYTRIKVEAIRSHRKCMYYVSKYCSKPESNSHLVIGSYRNKISGGKPWGIFRKNLLPLADKTEAIVVRGEVWKRICAIAHEAWDGIPKESRQGWTLFGEAAGEIQKVLDEYLLTVGDYEYNMGGTRGERPGV